MEIEKDWRIKLYANNKEIETKCGRDYYGMTKDQIKWVLCGWVAGLCEKYKHPRAEAYEIRNGQEIFIFRIN